MGNDNDSESNEQRVDVGRAEIDEDAATVSDVDTAGVGVTIDRALERIVEIEQLVAGLQAEQARLVARVVDDPCAGSPAPRVEKEYVREELRAALGESAVAIGNRIETARMLVYRLPAALAAMSCGQLRLRHVQMLADALVGLPDGDVAKVEAECVPFAAGRDFTAFARKVRRAVLALDSRTVDDRLRTAVEDRRIWCHPNSEGATATFGAVLPAVGAQTVLAAVDAEAARSRMPDDARTVDQRRADALVQIAEDSLAGTLAGRRRCGLQPAIEVTVAASTLLGLNDQPGELAGHGPIPAAVAREVAADPSGTWRRLVTDDLGKLIDYGRTRYRPPARLRDHVVARDRECQFPGCHRDAQSCEIDHLIAWTDGGSTCEQNLAALCPRHHHLKHEGGWRVQRLADGTVRWTSPSGRVYDNPPMTYPVDPAGDRAAGSDGVVPDDNAESCPPDSTGDRAAGSVGVVPDDNAEHRTAAPPQAA